MKSNLPELTKQNKQKEASFGVFLKGWVEKNPILASSIETKDTRGKDYLAFSEVKDKQVAFAKLASSDKGVWVRVQGVNGEADYIWLRNTPAYIVIKYPKNFYFIPIENFIHEKGHSKRKSLTEQRASEISTKSIKLKPLN